jgi:hypothetical protein
MTTYHSNALNFSIAFPANWTHEEDGNVLSVYDSKEGVGALQFSSYEVDDIASVDLKAELEDYVLGRHEKFSIKEVEGYAFCKGEDEDEKGNIWKYWIFKRGSTLVFASYNCLKEDVGKEDTKIEAIVKSAIDK